MKTTAEELLEVESSLPVSPELVGCDVSDVLVAPAVEVDAVPVELLVPLP